MENSDLTEKVKRNKENYLKAKEAFNRNDLDECLSFYALDHEVKSKNSVPGRDGIRQFLENIHHAWEDIQIVVEHVVAEDDWVMARSRATATHSKAVLGVAPTNKKIAAEFWDLHRFNDEGLIIETWNLMDNTAIMQQLGLLPS